MKPAPFRMLVPRSIEEALTALAEHDAEAKLLAGGQTLVPVMNFRMATPSIVIDLNRIPQLAAVRLDGDTLRIGAMVRQKVLLEDALVARYCPLLACAAGQIGHVQTRNRGTVGGSLAHADPAAELPLVAVTLEATLELRSVRGIRSVQASEFFTGPLSTALAQDEILTEVSFRAAAEGTRAAFREFSRRHGDFAIAAAAAQLHPVDGLQAGLGGMGGVPRRCALLSMRGPQPAQLLGLIKAEVAECDPYTDFQASGEYRRRLASKLLADCISTLIPR